MCAIIPPFTYAFCYSSAPAPPAPTSPLLISLVEGERANSNSTVRGKGKLTPVLLLCVQDSVQEGH